MADDGRRQFLKSSATLFSAIALARCVPATGLQTLAGDAIHALGTVVLPGDELGEEGVARVVEEFLEWLDGFEPEAELNHGYFDHEIRHAPPDPRPRWLADLEALEQAAGSRHGRSLVDLGADERTELVRTELEKDETLGALDRLPRPAEASHVGIALAAHFYRTPEANDRCYRAAIERWTCRGLESAALRPKALERG